MVIQHQALSQHLKGKMVPIYVLVGPDEYFVNEEAAAIKKAFKAQHDCDEQIMTLLSPDDWKEFEEQANSYSLFASHNVLDLRYDKKSLDSMGKKIIQHYLTSPNLQSLVVLRAPNIPAKQLLWLSSNKDVVLVTAYSLNEGAMRNWIAKQLQENQFKFNQDVVDLIYHKVQGNMQACAQAIEKLNLTYEPGTQLVSEELLEQLSDQSEFQLYDLSEACLAGQPEKALAAVRKLIQAQAEYSLVLWILTQEIRTLIQLKHLEKTLGFSKACDELKIWKQRVRFYQIASKRLSEDLLEQLLMTAYQIDNLIKSSSGFAIQYLFESLALSLSLGRKP